MGWKVAGRLLMREIIRFRHITRAIIITVLILLVTSCKITAVLSSPLVL